MEQGRMQRVEEFLEEQGDVAAVAVLRTVAVWLRDHRDVGGLQVVLDDGFTVQALVMDDGAERLSHSWCAEHGGVVESCLGRHG